MITLELRLRDEPAKLSNMKNSMFRKTLFNVCKSCFEKFFDAGEKAKSQENKVNDEPALITHAKAIN